jgi:hypothetical protein
MALPKNETGWVGGVQPSFPASTEQTWSRFGLDTTSGPVRLFVPIVTVFVPIVQNIQRECATPKSGEEFGTIIVRI